MTAGELSDGTSQLKDSSIDPRDAADRLFASATLVELLVVFCADPGRRYYVNELIRQTGRFPRSVQLALAKLESAGMVRTERTANVRYYQVDSDHPFFPELATICRKVADVTATLRRALIGVSGLRVVFLRPDDPDSSDLDLVAIGEEGARGEVNSTLTEVSARLGRRVRLNFVSADDWLRQTRRERSFVRWLLDEPRRYVVGSDANLPGS